MIEFSDSERELIGRLSVKGGWDASEAVSIKAKIKPYLMNSTGECCCYCRLSMHGWHGLSIDIEHVLPKGHQWFFQHVFELKNLSVSCKRCNMGIKRGDVSFYVGPDNAADPFHSRYYSFVHPNLDAVSDHLRLLNIQIDDQILVKYQIVAGSHKGAETYRYFQLAQIEINRLDNAQGLIDEYLSESFPAALADQLKNLLQMDEGTGELMEPS